MPRVAFQNLDLLNISKKSHITITPQEHEDLQKPYSGPIPQIDQITPQIDVLLKSSTDLHFQSHIVSATISSFLNIQAQCRNGISTISRMIVALRSKLQTMKRIFLHTENERNAQAPELHILAENRQILQAQLALRNQQFKSQ
jgi:hypothetical protein